LNWRGALDTQEVDGRPMLDLKLHGTSIFVEAARLYALAHGVAATGTRERLLAVAVRLGVPAREAQSAVSAFEFLQMQRLLLQLGQASAPDLPQPNPNLLDVASLNDIDRRMLLENCKVARSLQQRLELDYRG
jgi:CBS domain-containing protein